MKQRKVNETAGSPSSKKKIVVLGGYGEMGRVTVIDLVETFKGGIIIAGRNKEKARQFANSFKNKQVTWAEADVTKHDSIVRLLRQCDVVINATQYTANIDVMAAALEAKIGYVDLGGLFHMTRKQLKLHKRFKAAGRTAILGCGATPGITNVMAAYGAALFDHIGSIHVQFADKDFTRYSMPFAVPYSMRTIFDEFSMKPAIFSGGRFQFVAPIAGKEEILFPPPVNRATCFYTLHSEVATFPLSFKDKGIKDCSFKGGFDAGFVDKIRFLIDTGFSSEQQVIHAGRKIVPRDFAIQLLNKFIPEHEKIQDAEFLRIAIDGKKGNKRKSVVIYCKAVSNKRWNIPAGSWDTGTPPSIIAQMMISGEIQKKGVLPPEQCIQPSLFFKKLRQRNMIILIEEDGKRRQVRC
ncbi:saccharopine dehydrogenase NADP-binding domain-containing protein [Candidatus Woesearchaeota archaeon]|nr:saccharopine dehydrogenase NADP-binding domain-containing protein [Candidatus Woesearchaeota archaeon]